MEMSEEQEVFTVQRVAAAVEVQAPQELLQLVRSADRVMVVAAEMVCK
jgi:hypothetical protein